MQTGWHHCKGRIKLRMCSGLMAPPLTRTIRLFCSSWMMSLIGIILSILLYNRLVLICEAYKDKKYTYSEGIVIGLTKQCSKNSLNSCWSYDHFELRPIIFVSEREGTALTPRDWGKVLQSLVCWEVLVVCVKECCIALPEIHGTGVAYHRRENMLKSWGG